MEYTSLANPGRLPPSSIVLVPRREKPKCLPDGSLLAGLLHYCPPPVTTRIPGSYRPLYSTRLPTLKWINFKLSPIPFQGNVVAGVIASSDYKETPMSFINHQLLSFHNPIPFVPKNHLEDILVE
jgi:hypothetical protein